MSTTLNENLNVIAENENIEIALLDGDISFISKLDDEPNDVGGMTSAQLKAEFDKAGNVIKDYINNSLIPEILAADAVEATRTANEARREANEEARISEERDRIASEEIRKANEDVRVANEALRVTAEQARIEAENNRHAVSADIITRSEKAADEAEKAAEEAKKTAATIKPPVSVLSTMLASGWVENVYSFETEYPNSKNDITIEVASTATAEQFEAFGGAMICGSADRNIATAIGDVPTVDIPIIIKVVAK